LKEKSAKVDELFTEIVDVWFPIMAISVKIKAKKPENNDSEEANLKKFNSKMK